MKLTIFNNAIKEMEELNFTTHLQFTAGRLVVDIM